jgi:hypothetical protein
VPAWWFEPIDEIRSNLAAAGLIDADGRIPKRAWTSWYLPAYTRREVRRESGRSAARPPGRTDARRPANRRLSNARPTLDRR